MSLRRIKGPLTNKGFNVSVVPRSWCILPIWIIYFSCFLFIIKLILIPKDCKSFDTIFILNTNAHNNIYTYMSREREALIVLDVIFQKSNDSNFAKASFVNFNHLIFKDSKFAKAFL